MSRELDYAQAIEYLYGLEPRGIRLELDRIRAALALRGDPHRALRVVHVAGTNGKGSVAAMVEATLREAGLRTGLYTSPHLHRFVERIRIAGEPVDARAVARRVSQLREALESPRAPALTFFETATLLAFESFAEAECDVVVVEVGLGGRWDATNVVTPELAVITHVALDHTTRLGDTLAEVAAEKAGILEPGVPAVVGVRAPEARSVIEARARETGAPLRLVGRDFDVEPDVAGKRVDVHLGERRLAGLPQPIAGAYQRDNVGVAAAAAMVLAERGFGVTEDAVRRGLAATRWPGRLERAGTAPAFLLDAAHNPDGCRALAAHLTESPGGGRQVLLFGAMLDKDHGGMLAAFDGLVAQRIYTVVPHLSRAAAPGTFAGLRPGWVVPELEDALERACEAAGRDGLVVVAGSIFLMAEVRARLLGERADPPIPM